MRVLAALTSTLVLLTINLVSPAPSCDSRNLLACAAEGTQLLSRAGADAPSRYARGVALLTQACDGKIAGACVNLGLFMEVGRGGAPDLEHTIALFQRACDLHEARGCENLATLLDSGRVPRDGPGRCRFTVRAVPRGWRTAVRALDAPTSWAKALPRTTRRRRSGSRAPAGRAPWPAARSWR